VFGFGKKKNGVEKEYHHNGNLKSEINYESGKEHGPIKLYHENGKIALEGEFNIGKRYGIMTTYHENGNKSAQLEYNVLGLQTGESFDWYESGQLKGHQSSFDSMGEANGVFTHFHPNGQMSIRGKASRGQVDGEIEEWDENGNLIKGDKYG